MEKVEQLNDKVLFGSSILNLIVFVACLSIVLCKTSFHLYNKFTILLSAFLLMFIFRALLDLQRLQSVSLSRYLPDEAILKSINSVATFVKSIGIYYFIVETHKVKKVMLEARTPEEG